MTEPRSLPHSEIQSRDPFKGLRIYSATERQQKLSQLAEICSRCQRCALSTGRTHSVFSDGNPNASIMIIGEGPGYNEDQTGKPFVGKAGQLLDQILASVGLDRQHDVYICNIVKCRPPQNRAPSFAETQACFGFLERQIAWVRPQIMLLAGASALKGLFPKSPGISRSRGQWLQWRGIWCMPIFHPAYLLRNDSREKGGAKWLTWQDMNAVKQRLTSLQDPELRADSESFI